MEIISNMFLQTYAISVPSALLNGPRLQKLPFVSKVIIRSLLITSLFIVILGTLPNSRTQNDVSVDDVYLHTSSNNAEGSENNLEGISDDTGYLKAMMVGQLSDKLKPDKLVWSSNSHSGLQQ